MTSRLLTATGAILATLSSLPALAQSSVTIYGVADAAVEFARAGNGSVPA